ncbi:MAG: homoserine O-acetyltransferase, partial [Bacteroidota bacterium]
GQIKAKALVIAINSDILFPPFEQRLIAEHIPDAQYVGVDSTKGHDGFLIEIPEIAAHIQNFLE